MISACFFQEKANGNDEKLNFCVYKKERPISLADERWDRPMISELILRSQAGDKAATLELIDKFNPLLKKCAFKLSYDEAYNDLLADFIALIHNIRLKRICSKSEGHVIDRYVTGTGSSLRTMLILFYLSNEGISIVENAGRMGVPLPEKLKDAIRELRQDK